MYVSPIDGGRWYTCASCGFKGDSIEFYQKAHNLSDIRDAIMELSVRSILPMPKEELSVDIINKYIETYVNRRKMFDSLIAESRDKLANLEPKRLDLLQAFHLWDGFRKGAWHTRIAQFVGIGDLAMLVTRGLAFPFKGFTNYLLLPYYDVPGRISSLLLLNKHGKKFRIYTNPEGTLTDDGLMMIDLLDTHNDTVIAVRDPIFAMHIQRRVYNISDTPTKMLVYDSQTNRAWQSIHARRLIFWEQENNIDVYSQSIKHPRAYVATRPGFEDFDLRRYLKNMSVAEILNRLERSAKPWGMAMKEFLLNGEFWQISETIKQLQLSAADIQRIYDACSPVEKARITQLFGDASIGRYITIGNMKIVESEDGWWILRGNERELGCNATIRLDTLVHTVDTDENIYEGVVSFKNERIKFRTPVAVIEKNAAEWLRGLMMQHVGVLKLSRSIQQHIIEIAKQFHDPQYVRRIGKIGWHAPLQTFVFPNFSIKGGQFDDKTHAMVLDSADKDVPAANLFIAEPKDGDWDLLLNDVPEYAAVWAGLACFMSSLLSPIVGTAPSPVAFVGGYGSVANVIGAHLVSELGIVTVRPDRPYNPLVEMPEWNKRHDYPVWLDLSEKNRKSTHFLRAIDGGNFMTHLSEAEAAAVSVGESWVCVNAPSIMPQRSRLPSLRGALAFLGWMQSNNFDLPAATSFQQCVLSALSRWASGKLDAMNSEVFISASKMLRTTDIESLERRLLHLIFFMVANQRLKITHAPFYDTFRAGATPSSRTHLLIDDDAEKFYVNLRLVMSIVDRTRLPHPDYDAAIRAFASVASTAGFEQCVDGFILDQKYWDSEVAKWRKTK